MPGDSQDPTYYVLEGPDPTSCNTRRVCDIDRMRELRLQSESEADLEHVYETPDGSEADVYDGVYSCIDDIRPNLSLESSPQSPVYVELERPFHEEVAI